MRSFVAIELSEDVKRGLAVLVERLQSSGARLTWVKPEAMHLTLRFLGDVEPEPLERFQDLLADAYRGVKRFPLEIRGLGAFPNARRPSVLWAGVEPVDGELSRIQAETERAARAIGLEPENRAFHPHLTLARVKDADQGAKVMPYWDREQGYAGGAFTAEGVTLFSSRLTPRGPVYERIQEFPFQ